MTRIHVETGNLTGTGIAGFPAEEAARIMVRQVVEHAAARCSLTNIYFFVLFDEPTRQIFQKILDQVKSTQTGKR
jgi:O-acetyl-ADP-ribose deacetylase (regulator of RNase III)